MSLKWHPAPPKDVIGEDLLELSVKKAGELGADYADARAQALGLEVIRVENGELRSYELSETKGVGIRVLLNGRWGFASTTHLSREAVLEAVEKAIKIARASASMAKAVELAEVRPEERIFESSCKLDPADISPEEKVGLLMDINKASLSMRGIKSARTALAVRKDEMGFLSSEGARLGLKRTMVGIFYASTGFHEGVVEEVSDSSSATSGWEFIRDVDWLSKAEEISKLAAETAKARGPPAGTYPVVVDGRLVGLLLHEAFGHATEGDIVVSGDSVLMGKLGTKVASELVNVVDEGVRPEGLYMPFDDEGVLKGRTVLVEGGVLKAFLTSRETAAELGLEPTGNGRSQDFSHFPIVRQTNYYMEPGDYSLEELVEDVDFGFLIRGRGAGGGQVETGMGSFTFRAGPSNVIRRGEVCELVRGVAISGYILETLGLVEAVGKDFELRTSVFGGCGKMGQTVPVGGGGPPVRIRRMVVGGA